MKVKDFVAKFANFNPEDEVLFSCDISCHRSTSVCYFDGDVSVGIDDASDIAEIVESVEEEGEYQFTKEVADIIRKQTRAVVVNISGEENYNE